MPVLVSVAMQTQTSGTAVSWLPQGRGGVVLVALVVEVFKGSPGWFGWRLESMVRTKWLQGLRP